MMAKGLSTIRQILWRLFSILGISIFSLLLSGCGEEKKPGAPAAFPAPAAQTITSALPQESPEEEAKHSGGLGLSHKALELRHRGSSIHKGGTKRLPAFCLGSPPNCEISFFEQGKIKSLIFNAKKLKTVSEARAHAKAYLPDDAQLLETYSRGFDGEPGLDLDNLLNGVIDVYRSEWLTECFTPEEWHEAGSEKPGEFYIKFSNGTSVIEVGKAPPRSNELSKRLKNYSR